MQLDETDLTILELLQKDSKMTIKELANNLGLSSTPVYDRIKRLEKRGVIEYYTIHINRQKIDKKMTVICLISVSNHDNILFQEFHDKLKNLPQVSFMYQIAGSYDYLLQLYVRDIEEYQLFLNKHLMSNSRIRDVHSSFVLEHIKENNFIPLRNLQE